MKAITLTIATLIVLIGCTRQQKTSERQYLLERVGDYTIAQIYADGFEQLPLNQKKLSYYLSLASLAGRDINFDQRHRHGLEVRRLLEEIVTHNAGIDPEVYDKILKYTKLTWINNGFYGTRTARKFVCETSFEEFVDAAKKAQANGAAFEFSNGEALEQALNRLRPTMFDLDYEPFVTSKNPPKGQDILSASANNLYENVTLKDLQSFEERYPLNSKLIKKNGKLQELVYRAAGGDPKGLYRARLDKVIEYLQLALPYAEGQQREALELLIEYLRTGSPDIWRQYNITWVSYDPSIELILGFIEVYLDARGQKGEYEGLVSFRDEANMKLMKDLALNAQYFEDKAPWSDEFKQTKSGVPLANAITALLGIGNAGPVSWSGINLPNEQDIRQEYGTKSWLIFNIRQARRKAREGQAAEEFSATPEEVKLNKNYGDRAWDVIVALHEVVGHGSGKKSDALERDPADYLAEYYSTLEEARADLMALWNLYDPKLIELEILPNTEAAKAGYVGYVRDALEQHRFVPEGHHFEEDHQRGTNLIISYLRSKHGCIEEKKMNGKTYWSVTGFEAMREGVGELLSELMRIKATGDYQAAKHLVDTYGTKFEPRLRDEVLERARQIGMTNFTAFCYPELTPELDDDGKIVDIAISYPKDFQGQMLKYAKFSKDSYGEAVPHPAAD